MSTHHPTFGRSSGIGSVFKSLTKSLKSSPNVPVQINPLVVGGGEDLQKLIQQLQSESLAVRASAASKLIDCISKYAISSIPEVWYLVRDLCDIRISPNYRAVAVKLMVQCIIHADSSVGTRLMFFKDIINFCLFSKPDPEYLTFLLAMNVLTKDGKDIQDFCIYDDSKNLNIFIESTLNCAYIVNDKSHEKLVKTLQFIHDCLHHSYEILDDTLKMEIMVRMLEIGSHTGNITLLTLVVEIMSTVVASGSISLDWFDDLIRFNCSIYALNLDPGLSLTIWRVFDNLMVTDSFQATVFSLCECVQSADLYKYRSKNTLEMNLSTPSLNACIGAMEVISKLQILCASQDSSRIEPCHNQILKSTRNAILYKTPLINSAYLRLFDRILSKDSYLEIFGINFNGSFDKVLPFQLWYSVSNSVYDVLNGLLSNSEQDNRYIQSICLSLQSLYENHELSSPKEKLVNFFMSHYELIAQENILFILNYYKEEKLCSLLYPFWKDNCIKLLRCFYYETREPETKIRCLEVIKDAFSTSLTVFLKDDINYELLFDIFKKSIHESDEMLLDYLFDNLFAFLAVQCPLGVFKQLCDSFQVLFVLPSRSPALDTGLNFTSIGSFTSLGHSQKSDLYTSLTTPTDRKKVTLSFIEKLGRAFARLFVISANSDSLKAKESYQFIIMLCNFALRTGHIDLILILCKCLIRIRVTEEGFIYFSQPQEMIGLSTSFKRNPQDPSYPSDLSQNYKWIYPESVSYLPERYFNKPTRNLQLQNKGQADVHRETYIHGYNNIREYDDDTEAAPDKHVIDLSPWLDAILQIMVEFVDWEVYSFIWAHFCPQLSNIRIFMHYDEQILRLKTIICEHLTLNLPKQVELPANQVTKADLQVVLVRTLSALVGYHDKFTKYDEDQIINSLIFGLGSWEKTAIPCISILTVCCYEFPLSIKKFLSVILTKLQTRVTSAFASAHTLEFLTSLIHIPKLTSNFTIDEYKRVFGIAFKYIQYAKDLKKRKPVSSNSSHIQKHGEDAQVESTPSTQSTELTPILAQYVLMASFNVISSWFLKINMNDRKSIAPFLVKNLVLCSDGGEGLDDQTVGFLDFLIRFTHSDLPLNIITHNHSVSSKGKEETSLNRWIVGNTIIGIEIDNSTGSSKLSIRRPTGSVMLDFKLHHQEKAIEGKIHPNYYLLQLFDNIDPSNNVKPIPIIEDSVVLRALNVLDRIPTVDFHKIGIVYIGRGQSTEGEVLQNQIGSTSYEEFLASIGLLARLKHANRRIYVGGLDTECDYDGEYTRYWRDKTTQIVFHVITMMPRGAQEQRKKAHIGNNYVNIYFDESELPYNFNLVRSQFNFLNIRISHHTVGEASGHQRFYKVQTYRRLGVPGVFATAHFKLISQENLAVFIRNLAIVANQFACVWHANGSESIWSQRVRQIKKLRDNTVESRQALGEHDEAMISKLAGLMSDSGP
ncbi:tuberous sclerosis 2 protein [Suhomyces tanzawaensis NRRL Y-17324]|uniref:Tuberous sclerosis 2 protein n=1 Tax=Suhomyces tanzawaensis NRRL Y-17324 TaxID=984487 RepID=A0A1E4SBU7_9ASCO|nr:tuberous sclerosis 2 protein [Suhomyces tanzawaensis NRRL Y-17324]ODV76979.1 tuberous sclerosis 2 protein [Suhomyces tanzawaensis NRRL Y-17324]